jgi:GNAT superfamily N-acetyltransferase
VSTNRLIAPALLDSGHDVGQFCSGESELDDWLKRRALKNQDTGASRTYAITDGTRVVGYYCLSAGGVAQVQVPGRVRRNMPDPIPVMIISRLAVDQMFQGQGLGRALLRDALLRTLQAADNSRRASSRANRTGSAVLCTLRFLPVDNRSYDVNDYVE